MLQWLLYDFRSSCWARLSIGFPWAVFCYHIAFFCLVNSWLFQAVPTLAPENTGRFSWTNLVALCAISPWLLTTSLVLCNGFRSPQEEPTYPRSAFCCLCLCAQQVAAEDRLWAGAAGRLPQPRATAGARVGISGTVLNWPWRQSKPGSPCSVILHFWIV